MTKFENPNSGRAQIHDSPDLFQIRVKSKSSPFITAFLGFWLCGWAFGEVTALSIVLSGGAGAATVFMLAWLGAWTVGGLMALTQFLWGIFGYELLSLSKGSLTINRHIPGFRRSWNYDVRHISNVHLDTSDSGSGMFNGGQNFHGMFTGRNQGIIKFDYGLKTPGFGLDLEESEARAVVKTLSARLETN